MENRQSRGATRQDFNSREKTLHRVTTLNGKNNMRLEGTAYSMNRSKMTSNTKSGFMNASLGAKGDPISGFASTVRITSISQQETMRPKNLTEYIFYLLSNEDFFLMKCAIRLFPLMFRDKRAEKDYTRYMDSMMGPRMTLLGFLGVCNIVCVLVGMGILIGTNILVLPRELHIVLFFVCQAFVITAASFVTIAPFFRAIFLCLTLSYYVLSFEVEQSGSLTNAVMLKVWTGYMIFVLSAFSVLIYAAIIQTRTRYSLFMFIFMAIDVCGVYIIQSLKIAEYANNSKSGEIITDGRIAAVGKYLILIAIMECVYYISLSLFGFGARYYNELNERITFYRWLTGEERIAQLQQKSRRKINGSTPVEDVLQMLDNCGTLVTESGLMESHVILGDILKYLQFASKRLSKVDQLFAVKLERRRSQRRTDSLSGDAEDYEQRFYGIYANVTVDDNQPEHEELENKGGGPSVPVSSTTRLMPTERFAARRQSVAASPSSLPNAPASTIFIDPSSNAAFSATETIVKLMSTVFQQLDGKIGSDWSLNLGMIEDQTPNVLVHVGVALLSRTHCFVSAEDSSKVVRFCAAVEDLYFPNPYHNKLHGAMVAHASMAIAEMLNLFTHSCFEPPYGRNAATLIVAALCHDMGHCGRNNAFHIASSSGVALLYNDQSVLENYHCALAFQVLVRSLNYTDFKSVRQRIIELILATDMGHHFDSIAKFRIRRRSSEFNYLMEIEDFWLVARMCVKAADLSHSMVDWHQHVNWSLRVVEEFYQQGEQESSMGLPISPLCDRASHGDLAKSQKGFIEFVVQPLMKEIEELEPGEAFSYECIRPLVYNKSKWEDMANSGKSVPIPDSVRACKTMEMYPVTVLRVEVFRTLHNLKKAVVTNEKDIAFVQKAERTEPEGGEQAHADTAVNQDDDNVLEDRTSPRRASLVEDDEEQQTHTDTEELEPEAHEAVAYPSSSSSYASSAALEVETTTTQERFDEDNVGPPISTEEDGHRVDDEEEEDGQAQSSPLDIMQENAVADSSSSSGPSTQRHINIVTHRIPSTRLRSPTAVSYGKAEKRGQLQRGGRNGLGGTRRSRPHDLEEEGRSIETSASSRKLHKKNGATTLPLLGRLVGQDSATWNEEIEGTAQSAMDEDNERGSDISSGRSSNASQLYGQYTHRDLAQEPVGTMDKNAGASSSGLPIFECRAFI